MDSPPFRRAGGGGMMASAFIDFRGQGVGAAAKNTPAWLPSGWSWPGRSPSWLGFSIQGRIKALATGKTYASIGDGWLAFSASGLDTQSAADIHRDSPFDPSVVCEADFLGPILLGF
jgi:hypothetical protein